MKVFWWSLQDRLNTYKDGSSPYESIRWLNTIQPHDCYVTVKCTCNSNSLTLSSMVAFCAESARNMNMIKTFFCIWHLPLNTIKTASTLTEMKNRMWYRTLWYRTTVVTLSMHPVKCPPIPLCWRGSILESWWSAIVCLLLEDQSWHLVLPWQLTVSVWIFTCWWITWTLHKMWNRTHKMQEKLFLCPYKTSKKTETNM